ncbi:methyltransferase domain-containing protein [Croceicoccus marinus]|uniref:Methyltransferase domain-containing protein n=1 Tax=Croceicoccus marinus TaxID=450378 RepID=A0A7G6VSK1_9SPHN|nr:methyltransferase domain-containing protein [Croceicoccus marinus]QNE04716.1 methyltransferase domain-containing protein [Croceicoccus marinus]
MTSLAERSRQSEQMDAEDLDAATYAQVMAGLARVNRWTFTAHSVLPFLKRAAARSPSFSLLDVGFGQGDMLRTIGRWARRGGIAARLVGVDLNPRSAPIARAATDSCMGIDFRTGDYADQADGFDFIISSQVAHHMTGDQLQAFIRHMEGTARRGWVIGDLHRHRLAYQSYPLLARALGVHRIVREDGQLSIARSFRRAEWADIMERAGLANDQYRIERRFPFRLSVERDKRPAP